MKDYREWELSSASRKQLRDQEKERLEALRERIAQAIYKATGEGTLITTMDAIMDVIAKADGGGAEVKPGFTLEDAGPAVDTPRKRGARTIYVDGPNGKGDNGSHIEVFGPDRDAFASLLLSMFGAEEVKPLTKAERLERYKRDILAAQAEREARRGQPASLKGGDNG